MTRWPFIVAGLGVVILVGAAAQAELPKLTLKTNPVALPSNLDGRPQAPTQPPSAAPHIGAHGGVLIVDEHGVLVVERSAGVLVRANREAKPVAELKFTPGLGELVHAGEQVFLADRGAGRVVRIAPGDAAGNGLAELASVELGEPHGLALTPDGATLLVTDVSEHALVALNSEDLSIRWRVELGPEPRAVAVSRDGSLAAVGFLTSGSLAFVDLDSAGTQVSWRGLEPRDHVHIVEQVRKFETTIQVAKLQEMRAKYRVPVETGRRYARNFHTLAFVGHDMLVAPHELATPQLQRLPNAAQQDSYGGGGGEANSVPPLLHQLAVVQDAGSIGSRTNVLPLDLHQPNALAYDLAHDVLYVGGYGDDRVAAIADVSQQMPYVDWVARVGDGTSCGLDGLALDLDSSDVDGERPGLWIHCEFRRQLLRLTPHDPVLADDDVWLRGTELTASARTAEIERGAELFRRGRDPHISSEGVMACANCHPEGRADGLTWRLGDSILQTPILAGRVGDSTPYKWDGQDPSLQHSVVHTIERLGGVAIERREDTTKLLTSADIAAIMAYLESLPPPRPRKSKDAKAVARGRAVFEAQACNACHAGPKLIDHNQHDLGTTPAQVDTPSLLGLWHSQPYYHDGSATDLWTLLTDRGTVHEMADTSKLSEPQLRDLNAYLESL